MPAQATPAKTQDDGALLPPVDVVEDAGGITLLADLPGVAREAIGIHIDADTLTIEGAVSLDLPEGMEPNHVEVAVPRYRRAFTLWRELDSQNVAAEFAHGVLKLLIPKAQHAQPRKVEIRVG